MDRFACEVWLQLLTPVYPILTKGTFAGNSEFTVQETAVTTSMTHKNLPAKSGGFLIKIFLNS